MNFKNTKDAYGIVTKMFHWSMALIILGLLLVGLYMTGMENSPQKFEVYGLHKSFGLLILWMVGLRILWRGFTVQPVAHENHAIWERILAKVTHLFLYGAMIGMPLSGWLMSSAGEYPVSFFGLQMPSLMGKDTDIAHLMKEAHEILAFTLIGAVALHAAGALKHHFMDKDSTLTRMMASPLLHVGPYIIIAVLLAFAMGVVALSLGEEETSQNPVVQSSLENQDKAPVAASQNSQWVIIRDLSTINFTSRIYNTPFTGVFPNFDGTIIFDPDNLETAQADITIYIKDMSSGDAERDTEMLGKEWFNISDYTTAHFKAIQFEAAQANNYIAIGELTIKNRSMPVTLPFTLDFAENGTKVYMNGKLSLNRLDFGLGTGRWEATDIVGLNVDIDIKLVAHHPL